MNTTDTLGQWVRNNAVIIIGMVLFAGIIFTAIIQDYFTDQPYWQVSITGEARVPYTPDIANVTLGVQIDNARSAQSALDQLNSRMDDVVAAIIDTGISPEQIQTQTYSLFPNYDYPETGRVFLGYSANQHVLIKLEDIDENEEIVSDVIGAANTAGANEVIGIQFNVSNLSQLKQQAVMQALEDANSRADEVAQAANVDLGKVVGWWENYMQLPGQPSPYYGYDGHGGGEFGGGITPAIPIGSQEIIVQVNVQYQVD